MGNPDLTSSTFALFSAVANLCQPSVHMQMRELQDQVDYMQRQIAQGGKWTSMLLHDRDLLLSCYQGACRDADSAHRESASLWQQVQELQQENEALKEAAAAASTRAKRSSTSAGLAHGQVISEP